jgi:Flp pilus assembly protein TadD
MKRTFLLGAACGVAIAVASPCWAAGAWPWSKSKTETPAVAAQQDPATRDAVVAAVEAALAEGRTVDAADLLNNALMGGAQDPRFLVLMGETRLARGDYGAALAAFRQAPADGPFVARARQGEGLALSAQGRGEAALAALSAAAAQDPNLWRAWNGVGREYDRRRDWVNAEAAYARALDASARDALVLNNRGYSRMLQGRLGEASADFVAALEKRPDLTAARGNLRLVLALQGDYGRASARGAGGDDSAALLNNAGFAALLRGDYEKAMTLLDEAGQARGAFYPLASENRKLAVSLKTQAGPEVPDGN